jgi:hypothetical protein
MIVNILFSLVLLTCHDTASYDIVKEFHLLNNKSDEINFIKNNCNNSNPSVLAYVLSVSMKQAEYEFNPFIKLVLFTTNKNHLELLITENPNNAHLRYVRLLVQEKSPVFLGYKSNIVEDKTFLKRIMNSIDETDYLDSYIIDNTSL